MARRLRPHELYDLLGVDPLDDPGGLGFAADDLAVDEAALAARTAGPGSSAAATILVAESRPVELENLTVSLTREGYQVLPARSESEITEALIRERVHVQVAIIRHDFLTSGGAELVRRLRSLAPTVQIIVQSGGLAPSQRRDLIRDLGIDTIDNDRDQPERTVELVRCVMAVFHCFDRIRADQEVRGLILAQLCDSLRTPLHVIQGYTEILRDEPTSPSAEQILDRLASATDAAVGILHDYLDLAQLEAPGMLVRRERVGIDEVVSEIRDVARHEIGTRPLRLVTDGLLTGGFIYTDGEKLRAILTQLIANAVKFTPIGVIRLTIRPKVDHTEFILTDGGPGIAEEELPGLFSPFRQRAGEILSSSPGQGVGLAIAQRLSELIGATLSGSSGDSGGASFVLSVPGAMVLQTATTFRQTVH